MAKPEKLPINNELKRIGQGAGAHALLAGAGVQSSALCASYALLGAIPNRHQKQYLI